MVAVKCLVNFLASDSKINSGKVSGADKEDLDILGTLKPATIMLRLRKGQRVRGRLE